MSARKLITGERHGKVLILMEIEAKNSKGQYDVIVFCFACRKAKRMGKKAFGGLRIVQSCGCVYRKKREQRLYKGSPLPAGGTPVYHGLRSRADWRYGRSLKKIH